MRTGVVVRSSDYEFCPQTADLRQHEHEERDAGQILGGLILRVLLLVDYCLDDLKIKLRQLDLTELGVGPLEVLFDFGAVSERKVVLLANEVLN